MHTAIAAEVRARAGYPRETGALARKDGHAAPRRRSVSLSQIVRSRKRVQIIVLVGKERYGIRDNSGTDVGISEPQAA